MGGSVRWRGGCCRKFLEEIQGRKFQIKICCPRTSLDSTYFISVNKCFRGSLLPSKQLSNKMKFLNFVQCTMLDIVNELTVEFTWNFLTSDFQCADIPIGLFCYCRDRWNYRYIAKNFGVSSQTSVYVETDITRLEPSVIEQFVQPLYHPTVTKLWSSINNVVGNRAEAVDITRSTKRRVYSLVQWYSSVLSASYLVGNMSLLGCHRATNPFTQLWVPRWLPLIYSTCELRFYAAQRT